MNAAATWRPVLEIALRHGFYAADRCPALRLVPTPRTTALLERLQALARTDANGLLLLSESDAFETDDAAALVWLLHCDDAEFANVTASAAHPARELLVFDAGRSLAPTDGEPARLHTLEFAGADECRPLATAQALDPSATLSLRDGPVGLVSVPLSILLASGNETGGEHSPARFQIRFAPRATVWRYCLVGDWPEPALHVVDLAQQVVFDAAPVRHLADGRDAIVFRSATPIALREHPPERFQLRSAAPNDAAAGRPRADKIVVKRLPAAAPRHFSREVIAGAPALVSEIFVHR